MTRTREENAADLSNEARLKRMRVELTDSYADSALNDRFFLMWFIENHIDGMTDQEIEDAYLNAFGDKDDEV
jgi:hypothetical protein